MDAESIGTGLRVGDDEGQVQIMAAEGIVGFCESLPFQRAQFLKRNGVGPEERQEVA